MSHLQFNDGPMYPCITSMTTWFHTMNSLIDEWVVPYFGYLVKLSMVSNELHN